MELNREDLRVIIFYNWKRGLEIDQCYDEMAEYLGDNSVSKATISYWFREFRRGRATVKDEPRPGRPVVVTDDFNIERVRKMIDDDPRVTYQEIYDSLKISSASIHTILHHHLGVRKVLCRWVPHWLTDDQKAERVRICRENLKMLNDGGHRIISKILTGDETYVHYYDAPTRQESKCWVYDDETPPAQLKQQRTLGKVLYAVFFRSTGLVKAVKLEGQKSVTAKWYTEVCLPEVLEGLTTKGLMLHHDNASSHKASLTDKFLKANKLRVVPHPPYSPDLAMCDFWLFSGLKRNLRGRNFATEDELDEAVMTYFASISKDYWLGAFAMWKERMERCIEVKGDYFE